MKIKWNQTAVLLSIATALFGQMPGTAYSQGPVVPPVKSVPLVKAPPSVDKALTFTYLKNQSAASYTSNVSGTTPGYVFRFISEPLILQGVDESRDYYYSVPQATLGPNHYLELSFSHSELLVAAQSTLTVSVDDKPVKSIFLTKETSQQGNIRIPLGTAESTLGFHKITLAKHSAVSNDLCTDQTNPANWVKIKKSSFLFLDTKTSSTSEDLLKEFPHPFVEPGTSAEVYGAIVVPDTPTADAVSSALQVATSLSSHTAAHRFVPILTETEWEKKGILEHVIAVGDAKHWKGPIQKLIIDNKIQPKLQEVTLDYFQMRSSQSASSKLLLLVSGGKGKSLKESVRLLTEPDLKKQLTGNHLVVQDRLSDSDNRFEPRKLTFSSFGYSHFLLDQADSTTSPMVVKLPSHWKTTGNGTLDLKVKVSPLLMQDETEAGKNNQLTVTVNGIPSTFPLRQLKAADKESDWYNASIPIDAAILKESDGALTISFAAYLNKTGPGCSAEKNKGRWVFVDKESALNMPHEISQESTFQHWPAPFVDDNGLATTAFLLPEHTNEGYMTQLSMLVAEMVSETGNHSPIPIFREPLNEKEQKELAEYNVIVMGDTLLINRIKQLADLHVINETTSYVAWMQESIWNKEKAMAVFESNGTDKGAKGSFVHPSLLKYLKSSDENGQIVIMSRSNEVFTVSMDDKAGGNKAALGIPIGNIPIWLIILIPSVFLILLVVYIRMLQKEKKKATRRRG